MFRWASLAWMVSLDVVTRDEFRRTWLVWAGLAVAVAWTLLPTVRRHRADGVVLWVDLGIAAGLVLGSGLPSPEGAIESRPCCAA